MKMILIEIYYLIGFVFTKLFDFILPKGNAILMYHQVLPENEMQNDITALTVSTSRFEEHLKFLKENYEVVELNKLDLNKKNQVVITFDDGYKDNLIYALPLLKKYQLPATIYVTTRFANGDTEMWWIELASILKKKSELKFNFNNQNYNFLLNTLKEKDIAYKKIRAIFVSLNYINQKKLISIIRENEHPMTFSELVLSWNELLNLKNEPLITIGAHTVNHPVLSNLEEKEASLEISNSIEELSSKLDVKVEHFAYPFGSNLEAGKREFELSKQLNIKTSTTTICGLANSNSNLHALPRLAIKNRTTTMQLKLKIKGWTTFAFQQQI